MNNLKWIKEDYVTWYPISGDTTIYDSPGPGVFQLFKNPNPQDGRLGLKRLGDKFEFDYKTYELGTSEIQKRVVNTWNSEYFKKTGSNLGIIYNGTKGTGKTVSAKQLCNEVGIPVIVIPYYVNGILEFIQSLDFEAVVLIDEAEKTFTDDGDDNSSQILLKLIDGVYSRTRKLYVLTTNTLNINENLICRPGRISYIKEFDKIPYKTAYQYVMDNLTNQDKVEEVMDVVKRLKISTIDIIKFLVNEINIHGEFPEEPSVMNIELFRPFADLIIFKYSDGLVKDNVIRKKIRDLLSSQKDPWKFISEGVDKKVLNDLVPKQIISSMMIYESDNWCDTLGELVGLDQYFNVQILGKDAVIEVGTKLGSSLGTVTKNLGGGWYSMDSDCDIFIKDKNMIDKCESVYNKCDFII